MKIKLGTETSAQLDWMVATCENRKYKFLKTVGGDYNERSWYETRKYSTDWSQGGPIIEREKIAVDFDHDCWNAAPYKAGFYVTGETALIAAMRAFVYSKLGGEIEIPEDLL
jgi:hypothetical protein